jgi:molybdopterin-containing oxidoreductase family membrane subunit
MAELRQINPPKSTAISFTFIVAAILLIVGVLTGIYAFFKGHMHMYGVTREVPWGLLIATYASFAILSTGLCIVAAVGHIFGAKSLEPLSQRALFMAIISIIAAFISIGLELENPWRMAIWMVLSPNLTSNIMWMGLFYAIAVVLMIIEFILGQLAKKKAAAAAAGLASLASIAGLVGLLTDIAANSNLGEVFGFINAKPYWYGPFLSIYFISNACLNGFAGIVFFTWAAYGLFGWEMDEKIRRALVVCGKFMGAFAGVVLFLITWWTVNALAGKVFGQYEAVKALVAGPFAFNFWFFEILLGLVVPLLVTVYSTMQLPSMPLVKARLG